MRSADRLIAPYMCTRSFQKVINPILVIERTRYTAIPFKDARSVSFRSILFTSYILTIFKQQNRLP